MLETRYAVIEHHCWGMGMLVTRTQPGISRPTTKGLLLAAILLATPTACLAQYDIGHGKCCGRQDVILIRGGAGYWPGAEPLANNLTRMGYKPTIIQHWQYSAVADQIAAATRQGKMAGGVILIGYSSGADGACQLAGRLQQHGVRVQTMVLIESTFGIPVPANVDYCVNYYESRRMDFLPMFRGVPVAREGARTRVHNINVANNPRLGFLASKNHFTVANSPGLFQMVGRVIASRQPAVLRDGSQTVETETQVADGAGSKIEEDSKTTVQ